MQSNMTEEVAKQLEAETQDGSTVFRMKSGVCGETDTMRNVEVVLLLVRSQPSGGKIMMEQEFISGVAKAKEGSNATRHGLPGAKRRGDEPIEAVARRVIAEDLGLPENCVTLNLSGVESFQDTSMSVTMGLLTHYKFFLVPAYLSNVREKDRAAMGLSSDGAVWSPQNTKRCKCYTWVSEAQSHSMKVRIKGDKTGDGEHDTRPKESLEMTVASLAKQVGRFYQQDRNLSDLEAGMAALEDLLNAERASVETVAAQGAARRVYVAEHAEQLRTFRDALREVEALASASINPVYLDHLPGMDHRLRRLEAGSVVIASASARLHERVCGIAQQYHSVITGVNEQLLQWNQLCDAALR